MFVCSLGSNKATKREERERDRERETEREREREEREKKEIEREKERERERKREREREREGGRYVSNPSDHYVSGQVPFDHKTPIKLYELIVECKLTFTHHFKPNAQDLLANIITVSNHISIASF